MLFSYLGNGPCTDDISALVAYETPLENIFNCVEKVAVFTSLGGFEALIRGLPVITYGLPFYAGWGISEDKLKDHIWAKRRTRKLSLEELIFISLIDYPFYNSLNFQYPMEIENVIEEIISAEDNIQSWEQIIFKYWGILRERFLN